MVEAGWRVWIAIGGEDRGSKIEDRKSPAEMSGVEPDWPEATIKEGLEEVCGGECIELALFAGTGEFFPGALARDQLLFGIERTEALIYEDDGNLDARRELARPADGFLRSGAEGVVHVEGQAKEDALDAFFFDELK